MSITIKEELLIILSFAKQELPDLDKFLSVLNQEVVSTDPYQLDLHIVNGLSLTEILLHLAVNNDDIVDDRTYALIAPTNFGKRCSFPFVKFSMKTPTISLNRPR